MTDGKTPQAYDLRAEAYARSRPTYPADVLPLLHREIGFSPDHNIADIGSGPGTFAQTLIEYGNEVFAVEPGADMRRVAERLGRKALGIAIAVCEDGGQGICAADKRIVPRDRTIRPQTMHLPIGQAEILRLRCPAALTD